MQTSFSKSDFLLGGDGIKSMFSKYVTNLGDTLVTGIVFYMESDDDPVMRVKNVGDWMVTGAEAAIAVRVASIPILAGVKDGALASSVPGSAAVGGIAAGVLSFVEETWKAITPSMYTILYGGYFLSIWIPSVPYYIFGIGVVGWMIFVVEMMAAGVLWAAAHTTPTREDSFIGSQTQGYLLVMSGFFRPALMVLGLVASQAVINPIVHFVNESFVANFRSIQATSTTGLFSLAGFVLVYCFIMLAAFMLVFSLPQSLPDRILRWIGAGIQDIGEQNTASRIEAGASSQSRNAAMAAAKKSADGNKKSQGEKMSSKQNEHSTKGDSPEGISGQSTVTNPD